MTAVDAIATCVCFVLCVMSLIVFATDYIQGSGLNFTAGFYVAWFAGSVGYGVSQLS